MALCGIDVTLIGSYDLFSFILTSINQNALYRTPKALFPLSHGPLF